MHNPIAFNGFPTPLLWWLKSIFLCDFSPFLVLDLIMLIDLQGKVLKQVLAIFNFFYGLFAKRRLHSVSFLDLFEPLL